MSDAAATPSEYAPKAGERGTRVEFTRECKGTDFHFRPGEVHELNPASANRWVRRGAAVFVLPGGKRGTRIAVTDEAKPTDTAPSKPVGDEMPAKPGDTGVGDRVRANPAGVGDPVVSDPDAAHVDPDAPGDELPAEDDDEPEGPNLVPIKTQRKAFPDDLPEPPDGFVWLWGPKGAILRVDRDLAARFIAGDEIDWSAETVYVEREGND